MSTRVTRNTSATNNNVTIIDLTKNTSTQPCCSNQTANKQPAKSKPPNKSKQPKKRPLGRPAKKNFFKFLTLFCYF